MELVGITGTNGKTTISYLIEAILKEAGKNCGVIGTVNYRYNDKVIDGAHTTPESTQLSALMADMVAEKVTHAVVEVSSHALSQKRTEGCRFASAIFTNLTHEHLDYHETMENYYEAKARLFTELMDEGGVPVINFDDEWGARLARSLKRATTFSLEEGALIFPENVEITADSIGATVNTPEGQLEINSSLVGEYNLSNILAAIGAAQALGIDNETIAKGIASVKRIPGRLDRVSAGDERTKATSFFVDYAHTPDALERVLETLGKITKGRLITVFGCGGDRDADKRALMGEISARLSDITIITSDNPRSEEPKKIIEDIEAGFKGVEKADECLELSGRGYVVHADRREAIEKAVECAKEEDTVLVAGKGHEDYQLVGKKRLSFDDYAELKAALARMTR